MTWESRKKKNPPQRKQPNSAGEALQRARVSGEEAESQQRGSPAFQRVIANSREGEGILHIRKNTTTVPSLKRTLHKRPCTVQHFSNAKCELQGRTEALAAGWMLQEPLWPGTEQRARCCTKELPPLGIHTCIGTAALQMSQIQGQNTQKKRLNPPWI